MFCSVAVGSFGPERGRKVPRSERLFYTVQAYHNLKSAEWQRKRHGNDTVAFLCVVVILPILANQAEDCPQRANDAKKQHSE